MGPSDDPKTTTQSSGWLGANPRYILVPVGILLIVLVFVGISWVVHHR